MSHNLEVCLSAFSVSRGHLKEPFVIWYELSLQRESRLSIDQRKACACLIVDSHFHTARSEEDSTDRASSGLHHKVSSRLYSCPNLRVIIVLLKRQIERISAVENPSKALPRKNTLLILVFGFTSHNHVSRGRCRSRLLYRGSSRDCIRRGCVWVRPLGVRTCECASLGMRDLIMCMRFQL